MDGIGGMNLVRARGGEPRLIGASISFDSGGTASLSYDFQGTVSISTTEDTAGPTGVYVLTFQPWAITLIEPLVSFGSQAAVEVATATTPATGLITLTFGSAPTSTTARVMALVSESHAN